MFKTEKKILFGPMKKLFSFSTEKYWRQKFVDSYSENSWKHVVSSIIDVKTLDESADDVITKQFVFVIGTEVIKELRNKENKLSIEVTIHDLKGETKNEDVESGVEDESYVTINNVKKIEVVKEKDEEFGSGVEDES